MLSNLRNKNSQKLPDHTEQSSRDALETSSKRAIKKLQKQQVILFVIQLLLKLEKSQKYHHKILQRHLKMKQIRKERYISP